MSWRIGSGLSTQWPFVVWKSSGGIPMPQGSRVRTAPSPIRWNVSLGQTGSVEVNVPPSPTQLPLVIVIVPDGCGTTSERQTRTFHCSGGGPPL